MEYGGTPTRGVAGRPVLRLATETKQAFRTTEFWIYLVLLLGILIAGTVDDAEGSAFGADDVWLYATLLTIGYLISRGLAKAGSRDPYWDDPNAPAPAGDSLADRVKGAAQVLKDGEPTQGEPTHGQGASAPAPAAGRSVGDAPTERL